MRHPKEIKVKGHLYRLAVRDAPDPSRPTSPMNPKSPGLGELPDHSKMSDSFVADLEDYVYQWARKRGFEVVDSGGVVRDAAEAISGVLQGDADLGWK